MERGRVARVFAFVAVRCLRRWQSRGAVGGMSGARQYQQGPQRPRRRPKVPAEGGTNLTGLWRNRCCGWRNVPDRPLARGRSVGCWAFEPGSRRAGTPGSWPARSCINHGRLPPEEENRKPSLFPRKAVRNWGKPLFLISNPLTSGSVMGLAHLPRIRLVCHQARHHPEVLIVERI